MTDRKVPGSRVPSDLAQISVIARLELIRYIKGFRFVSIMALSVGIVLMLYYLPLAFGDEYSGHSVEFIMPAPVESEYSTGYHSMIYYLNWRIFPESIEIRLNGTLISVDDWLYADGPILFKSDLSDNMLEVTYDWGYYPIEMADKLMIILPYMIVIIAILVGSDSLAGEIQNRTAYLVYPNPVKRIAIVIGKFIASLMVGIVAIVSFYLAMSALIYSGLGTLPDYLLISLALSLLYFAACLAFAYAISSISKNSTGSIVFAFLLLIALFPILQQILISGGVKPWFLPSFAAETINRSLLLDDYPQDIIDLNGSVPYYEFYPDPLLSALFLAVLTGILVGITVISLYRRDINC